MIYKAFSSDEKRDYYLEITPMDDNILFHIVDPEDWQSSMTVLISTEDFIKFLKGMAVNNDIRGIKLTVTDEAENV